MTSIKLKTKVIITNNIKRSNYPKDKKNII